jgi:hypothetical protein
MSPPPGPLHPLFSHDSTLVGNCIYWLLTGKRSYIVKFDLALQSLANIEVPPGAYQAIIYHKHQRQFLITPTDVAGLAFLFSQCHTSLPNCGSGMALQGGCLGILLN